MESASQAQDQLGPVRDSLLRLELPSEASPHVSIQRLLDEAARDLREVLHGSTRCEHSRQRSCTPIL